MRYAFLSLSIASMLAAYLTKSQETVYPYFLLCSIMSCIMFALWPKIKESVNDDENV